LEALFFVRGPLECSNADESKALSINGSHAAKAKIAYCKRDVAMSQRILIWIAL
jgi:hypothetical protein